MNTKTICAMLIALLVGLLVGYLIWGGTKDVGQTDTGGTRGEWPMVPCPPDELEGGQMAFEVCDQITDLAMQVSPPTPQSMNCAVKAQRKKSANPPDPMAASATLHGCLLAAQQGEWAAVETGLDTIPD